MTRGANLKLIPLLLLIAFAGTAGASGFALENQSGSGNGNAFAGAAAAAEDAGTIYFNPAGMTYLPRGHSISLSATLVSRALDFKDTGSTGAQLPTGNGGNAGRSQFLPAGYWAYGISSDWSVGLGVGQTFGNATEYNEDFVGRNDGFSLRMKQYNINPSLAYRLNEKLSLGGGVNFARNQMHFKQGVAGSLTNSVDVDANDWAVGYNLGAIYQVSSSTRIGLAYRSRLSFDLEGKQQYATPSGVLVNQDIKARLKMPSNLSLAVAQKLSDKWEMLGDATWTEWSVLDSLEVNGKDSGAPLQKLNYNFKNTWRVGLGANYQYNDVWKLRFGLARDKSPVKSAADRTLTLPDGDRTQLSFGAKYALSKAASLDLGYSHVFFAKSDTARAVAAASQTINGELKSSEDIVSLQYNQNF